MSNKVTTSARMMNVTAHLNNVLVRRIVVGLDYLAQGEHNVEQMHERVKVALVARTRRARCETTVPVPQNNTLTMTTTRNTMEQFNTKTACKKPNYILWISESIGSMRGVHPDFGDTGPHDRPLNQRCKLYRNLQNAAQQTERRAPPLDRTSSCSCSVKYSFANPWPVIVVCVKSVSERAFPSASSKMKRLRRRDGRSSPFSTIPRVRSVSFTHCVQ